MHNIPQFPLFRPLTIDDKGWYNEYFSHYPPYADFSFGDFIVWYNQYDNLEISLLNDNIVFKFTNMLWDKELVMNFLGKNKPVNTIEEIFAYQKAYGLPEQLRGIPEFAVEDLLEKENPPFVLEEERDQDEYVLDAKKIADLQVQSVRRYHKKFQAAYGTQSSSVALDLSSPKDVSLIQSHLQAWFTDTRNEEAQQEEHILQRALQFGPEVGYKCTGFIVNDQLVGMIVYQPLPQGNIAVANHIKGDYSYTGIFTYIVHAFATYLTEQGMELINFEQDLGIPGIRFYKEHLEPIRLLKKYSVSPRQ